MGRCKQQEHCANALWCVNNSRCLRAETSGPLRMDGLPESRDERHLRRLLAYRVGMPGAYYDDDEATGSEHGIVIDFMRDPVADIDAKLRALNVARLECDNTPNAGIQARP